jgi:uncharacterized protein (TIGR02246 family)
MTGISLFAALLLTAAAIAAPVADDETAAIRAIGAAYIEAWNHSDAAAMAGFFTEDGDLIIPTGLTMCGRAQIQGFYAQVFQSGYAGSKAGFDLQNQRMLERKLALLDIAWSIADARTPAGEARPAERGIATAIVVKTRGGWRIAALREQTSAAAITPAQP